MAATMTSLQIQSFASLIDQLPIGVEESERIDRAANAAACSSASQDGSAERAREGTCQAGGKNTAHRRDCSRSRCQDCRPGAAAAASPTDEPLPNNNSQVYAGSNGLGVVAFPPITEEANLMQIEQPATTITAAGCVAQAGVDDGFIPVTPAIPRDPNAQAQSTTALRGFPATEVVEPMNGPWGYGQEAAPNSLPASQEFTPDIAAALGQPGARGAFPVDASSVASSVWPPWGVGTVTPEFTKFGARERACGERQSGQFTQSTRSAQAIQGTPGQVYGGGQVQVSIVSPGEDVVVTSYGCADWAGCCDGCQVEVTRVSRPTSPLHLSSGQARQTGSPANIKVKSVSPSGPDQFVLCLEGESGHEQHVAIDRQELLQMASAQMQPLSEQERGAKGTSGRQGNAVMPKGLLNSLGTSNGEDGQSDAFTGVCADGRGEKWSPEVRKWQSQFCRELEIQKKRLQQREEACRKREEEFKMREDEARRQKMTIAALEGEVLKVTEEIQEVLLQKAEGRLIVQREFLERKGRYVSRLQDLRPFLGAHFEDVLRGLTSCRTIGQLSTWSSVFDSTAEMAPKVAAQQIIEVLKSGITAPLFASTPVIPAGANVVGVALDIVSRTGHNGSVRYAAARGPFADQCILRIPSLTNDSHVSADGAEIIADDASVGPGTYASRVCSIVEDQRLHHHMHVGEAIMSRCRHQYIGTGSPEDHGRDNVRGLVGRGGALWGGGIDSVSLSLGPPVLDPASVKDINGGPQFSVAGGQVILPSSAAAELTMDGIYLRPICSRLPSRTTSICGDHDSTHADWVPCRIDSRHAEETLDAQTGDGCGSWMERVAYANGGGSLSISFFNAAARPHRAPSPICG